jgi:hypothetical protein
MAFLPLAKDAKVRKFTDEPKFGTVVDNADPLKLGRVKVEIQGIFEGDAKSLPWVRRKTDTLFCGNDCEVFDVPEIGSVVEVRWNYDENTPIYSGAPYSKKHQTSTFTNNYPFEAGFKFGPNYIKFDKASKLITIGNSRVTIQLDALGGCSIACDDLDIVAKGSITMDTRELHLTGNLVVDGGMTSTQGASGAITMWSAATVSGGQISTIEVP